MSLEPSTTSSHLKRTCSESASSEPTAKGARLSAERDPDIGSKSVNSDDEDANEENRSFRRGMWYNELRDALAHLASYYRKRMNSKAVGTKEREKYTGTYKYYSSLVEDLEARLRDGSLVRTMSVPDEEMEMIETRVLDIYWKTDPSQSVPPQGAAAGSAQPPPPPMIKASSAGKYVYWNASAQELTRPCKIPLTVLGHTPGPMGGQKQKSKWTAGL